ncbi:MAG: DUF5710 domain-containing protein, partial [Pseudonocardiaceae bacterium]
HHQPGSTGSDDGQAPRDTTTSCLAVRLDYFPARSLPRGERCCAVRAGVTRPGCGWWVRWQVLAVWYVSMMGVGAQESAGRVWLDVPFAEKDEAKAGGARWDHAVRRWYAPLAVVAAVERWVASPGVPEVLAGEDRGFGGGLFVDLVPASCWFTNVRSCVVGKDWERLRRMITGRAGGRCEACGRAGDPAARRWLEAHERWAYDCGGGVQTLRRLVCLCTGCHTATHYGLAQVSGKADQALAHLCTVTGMSEQDAQAHVRDAVAVWEWRSARRWILDVSLLTRAGVALAPPVGRSERVRAAEEALRGHRGC